MALLLSPVAEKKKPNGFLHSISLILLSASVHSTSGVVLLLLSYILSSEAFEISNMLFHLRSELKTYPYETAIDSTNSPCQLSTLCSNALRRFSNCGISFVMMITNSSPPILYTLPCSLKLCSSYNPQLPV